MREKNLKISIQGLPASNSENVALRLYPNAAITYCKSFVEAINTLGKGDVDLSILPYGNLLVGSVRERITQDWSADPENVLKPHKGDIFVVQKFLNDLERYNFSQVEKYSHRIIHCLCGIQGSTFEEITDVYSHPMALLQCGAFIDQNNLYKHPFEDTAASAKRIAEENDVTKAAIADVRAARAHNLKVHRIGIADIEPNFTDFVSFTTKDKETMFFS